MSKQLRSTLLILSLVMVTTSYATTTTITGPWMTGPLLAPGGHTLPAGHLNLEPYLFVTDDYGVYNDQWKSSDTPSTTVISPTLIATYGINHWMDIQTSVPYNFNHKSGQWANYVGDVGLTLGFQLMNDHQNNWEPDLRFTVEETFPTGRYKNLSPAKLGTDSTGAGSYQTSIGTNFQKLFHLKNGKYLRSRLSLIYTLPSSASVTGFNSYGGGFGTVGNVNPGDKFNADFALEYTLTQHWVPAIDVAFTVAQGSKFSGVPGVTAAGTPAMNGSSSSEVLSLAPAIEYNFNAHVGIIAGTWFSVAGRNSPDFASGVIALNIYC